MLIHLAIGDAYGAGFEFVDAGLVGHHNRKLDGYFQHPRHLSILPGQYTDDTQMSLAVGEALLECTRPSPLQWANHFVACFQRDPRQGYAGRFYHFLLTVQDGADFLDRIQPFSRKSGAAMRALPLGLLSDKSQLLEVTADQARLTHNTPEGILSAQAVALTAHYFLYRLGPPEELADFVASQVGGRWTDWRGEVGGAGLEVVRAALSALHQHRSMSDLLRCCVDYTGDVDTVASIALGAAACCADYRRDLPDVLYSQLENGTYGQDYARQLQARLGRRFPGTSLD